jgi:hypothetical protein
MKNIRLLSVLGSDLVCFFGGTDTRVAAHLPFHRGE